MARIRTIKPELGSHEGLYDLEVETGLPIRFAWCMLFTVADRDGRFNWRPRTLKAQILPHDDIEFSRVLDAWLTRGFVRKYTVGEEVYGWIPTFTRHQVINNRESPSEIPPIEEGIEDSQSLANASVTRPSRVIHALPTREVHAQAEGKGREGKERPRGTRIPEDFRLTPERGRIASDEGLDAERVFAKFRDYWLGVAGAKGVKLDWDATWRNWVRSEAERNPGKKPTGGASGLPTLNFG